MTRRPRGWRSTSGGWRSRRAVRADEFQAAVERSAEECQERRAETRAVLASHFRAAQPVARCSTTSTLIGGNIARSTSPSTDHGELPPAGRATTRRLDPDGHAPRRRRARDTRQASWVNRSRTPAGRLGTPARSAGTIRPRAPQAGSTSEPSRLGRRPPSRAVGQLTTDRDRKGRYPQPANQPSPEAGAAERSKPTRLNRPQRHTGRGKQVQRKTAS